MNKSNGSKVVPARRTVGQRVVSLSKKAATVVAGSVVSASAFAQSADTPASLDAAVTFMQEKGGIAVAVAAAITLLLLGVTGAKLPRKAS